MEFKVKSLHTYPIKSCAGIDLEQARISSRGFDWDRHLMLVNSENRHVTQRDLPVMALLDVSTSSDQITVKHRQAQNVINISIENSFSGELQEVRIWKDRVMAQMASKDINDKFSDILKSDVRLVIMPDHIKRPVKNHDESIVGFADASQFLILSQSSLDHLNSKLENPILMNRFRPNIVVSGSEPHAEDNWSRIRIGNHEFAVTKKCTRCNLTQVDQETARVGEEPIRTLAQYRMEDGHIHFGVYLKHLGETNGEINVGDPLTIL